MTFLSVMYVFGFTTYSRTMAAFEQWLSESGVRGALFFAAAAAALAFIAYFRDRQIGASAALDYQGSADPVVLTLGLNPE
jgi:hypothetical protein